MRRKDIPETLEKLEGWPCVDASALDAVAREQYRRRERMIRAYFNGESLASIEKRLGIGRGTVSWFVNRCLALHPDGRIQGFRALIPFAHVKQYVRIKTALPVTKHGGLVGAFGQLIERFPALTAIIEREIFEGRLHLSSTDRLVGVRDTHDRLLTACREIGLTAQDYPLNQDDKAYRSFAKFARARLDARVPIRFQSAAVGAAQHVAPAPFSVVELDGHKLDVRLRVRYAQLNGLPVDVEIERLFVIVIIDTCTRAVLGWQLVLGSEYNRFDVLLAVQNALTPRHKRKEFSIPGLVYEPAGGFVTEVCPEAAYACWNVLKFDNARAHLAEDTLSGLSEFVGCRTVAGPVRQPTVRPFIERFFRTLTDRLSRRLPGTSGNRPGDPAGSKGKKLPVNQLVTFDELEELLDVTIANYNGTPHDGLNSHTPLEAMRTLIDAGKVVLRTLPQTLRNRIHQLQPAHLSTVRGNPSRSIAPYISLYGTRYSNDVIERTSGLLKTQIRIYVNPDDMREAWAYLPNGAELGRLNVLSGWRYSRHTLRLRQHILKLRRRGKLTFSDSQDPVLVYSEFQRAKARQSRKEGTHTAQVVKATPSPAQSPATLDAPSAAAPSPTRRRREAPVVATPLPDLDVQHF